MAIALGAGAWGGGHGGLLNAWCDDDQHLLMRCQGFFRGRHGGMKAFKHAISAARGGAYHLCRGAHVAGSY